MDLVQDKREVKIVEEKVHITRTTTEQYDAEEFLRTVQKLEFQKEQHESAMKDIGELLKELKDKEEEVLELRKKENEKQKDAVKEAIAKKDKS